MTSTRRNTRQLMLGNVGIGSDHKVSVQSMTTTKTRNTDETLEQVYALAANGADIVRVTCNEIEAAESLVKICTRSPVPIVADIHFQYKLALAAIEAGVQGLRLNPGNIRNEEQIKLVAKECLKAEIPIRIGVNAGSLDKDLLDKYGEATPEALVESALNEVRYIRMSLTTDPIEEAKHGRQLLEYLGLRERKSLDLIACPSCGRAEVDVISVASEAQAALENEGLPIQVAVMGCVVNGPGEARSADIGIAAGKKRGHLFIKGEVVKVVDEKDMVSALVQEGKLLAKEGIEARLAAADKDAARIAQQDAEELMGLQGDINNFEERTKSVVEITSKQDKEK